MIAILWEFLPQTPSIKSFYHAVGIFKKFHDLEITFSAENLGLGGAFGWLLQRALRRLAG
jgi:hypothetical protein